MIPFRVNIQSRTRPYVTIALIALNVAVFLYEISLPDTFRQPQRTTITYRFGFLPGRVAAALRGDPEHEVHVWTGRVNVFRQPLFRSMLLSAHPGPVALTLLTSMFMHGGWLHIIMNMWFLWIFGGGIEDRLGHAWYAGFYVLCGICAAGAQLAMSWGSDVPMVGASGAIAGVLGAYLIAFPWARVLTIVPIFYFLQFIELPAFLVLGLWFVVQFFSGVASISHVRGGGVAHWAHIGGFAAGLIIMLALRKRKRRRKPPSNVEIILPGERWHRGC